MHILLDGGYTLGSAGDDAPLSFLTDSLRARFKDVDFTVVARHPHEEFERRHGVLTVPGFEYESKAASGGRWFRGLNFEDDRTTLGALADCIADSDLLVLGAGNFLTEVGIDVLRGHLPRFAVMVAIAQLAGTPTMLFGLSANQLQSPWAARGARWLLHAADAVTFREQRAVDELLASGIDLPRYELLPDPALGAREPGPGRGAEVLDAESIPPSAAQRLGLAPRDLSWLDVHEQYLATQVQTVDRWLATSDERDVLIIPQCTYEDAPHTDDRVIGRAIAHSSIDPSRVHVIKRQLPHWDIEACYQIVDVVLATRLHGSVFAARQGVPVLGLAYEQKVAGFFDSLGLAQLCLPIEASADTIIEELDSVCASADDLSAQLTSRITELRTQLDRYIDIAIELLERPRPPRP